MRSETFTLHGQETKEGRIYLTSPDLHGFRLLVSNEANLEREVTEALRTFYPLYISAKAKTEARQREPRLSRVHASHGKFDMSAEFAFA